jgi:hypothetical protein
MSRHSYWITPPDLYARLNSEFNFDFDPCPYPRTFDGLALQDWGQSNYVNPPFRKIDGSPTAFARKAIEQHKKGKTVVLTLPTPSYVNLLLQAGAEARPLGRVRWLSTIDRSPMPDPSMITAFILRGGPAK